jgi:Putative transposase DNA-binding domain.
VWVGEQRPEWSSFECNRCGLRIDRQLNAAINLYMRLKFGYTTNWDGKKKSVELKMEGASQREWWDKVVLPSLPRLVRPDRGGAEDSR